MWLSNRIDAQTNALENTDLFTIFAKKGFDLSGLIFYKWCKELHLDISTEDYLDAPYAAYADEDYHYYWPDNTK